MFKTKAGQLERALKEKGYTGKVAINQGERVAKGSFIVRAHGAAVLELKELPRPFTTLRSADMAEVAAKIVKA